MRIFYDFEAFSDQSRGGITRYVMELAGRVAAEADVLVYAGVHRSKALRELAPAWARGIYVPSAAKTGEMRRRLNTILTRRAINRFRPDIVHRTYYRHGAIYPGAHRDIMTLHDLIYFRFPEVFPRGADVVQGRIRDAARRTDLLICVSNNTRADAIRFLQVDKAKTSVIPLGVSAPLKVTGPAPCPGPYILFVGQRGGYKNFSGLLEGMARSPAAESHMILAFGGEPFSEEEMGLVAQHGMAGRIQWMSGDDDLLAQVYSYATALVYPSRYEGFGLPVLEAMAYGCPVICSGAGSLPEVAGEAAEYFSPDDSTDLASAIGRAVLDPVRRDELRCLGRENADHFSWDKCATQTLSIYRTIVGT